MLTVEPIDAFRDNYIWLLYDPQSRRAIVVDPGEAEPVSQALTAQQLSLAAIFVTHHHSDHTGGIGKLRAENPKVQVFGPLRESISHLTHRMTEGETITIPNMDTSFRVLEVPGHTAGHIAFYGENALFCGDTLFSVGCGRLFEGTAQQMYASLCKIAALPDDTWLYCAHEYTLDNIAFAKWVEPDNSALLRREQEAYRLQDQDKPTIPSSLRSEKQTNPFLRSHEITVIRAAEQFAGHSLSAGAEVLGTIRRWKDTRFD